MRLARVGSATTVSLGGDSNSAGDQGPLGTDFHRSWFGAVILVIAIVAMLVVPRLLSPGLVGAAAAAPMPAPPAVGSCLNGSADAVVVVECSEPHVAEVVLAWRAGERKVDLPVVSVLEGPLNFNREVPRRDQQCLPAVRDYVVVGQPWSVEPWVLLPPSPMARYLVAPPDQGLGDQRWSACVATTQHSDAVTGSMRAIARTFDHPWPAAFTHCLALGDHVSGDPTFIACDQPHRIEILADSVSSAPAPVGGDDQRAAAGSKAGCDQLAATALNTPDPEHGDLLAVKGLSGHYCYVELVGDGQLTGTVIGLGAAPLPLT